MARSWRSRIHYGETNLMNRVESEIDSRLVRSITARSNERAKQLAFRHAAAICITALHRKSSRMQRGHIE
jgi:hypothetical protein